MQHHVQATHLTKQFGIVQQTLQINITLKAFVLSIQTHVEQQPLTLTLQLLVVNKISPSTI